MINHHVCYEEIHGYELIILMPKSEHRKLHNELRKKGKCNISANELNRMSNNSKHAKKLRNELTKKYHKNNYKSIHFTDSMMKNVRLHEIIQYNYKTGNITYASYFDITNIRK